MVMRKKTVTTKESQPRSPNNSFDGLRGKKNDAGYDIIELILQDHLPLKDLIETLKDDDLERKDKAEAFEEFAYLLTCHAKAEEQVLYVAMKNFDDLKVESFEGDTEHGIADQLVQEINATPDDNEWLAKVKVLAESVEHHIEEEETEMLTKVQKTIPNELRMNLGSEYTRLIEENLKLFEIQTPRDVKFQKSMSQPVTHL
jgi:hemerythrin superfamily protein